MRRHFIRRGWKWTMIAAAIVAGWMLGSMHASAPAQDMFETPADYPPGPALAIDGTGSCGKPVRSVDAASLWVPRGSRLEKWNITSGKVETLVTLPHRPTEVVLSSDEEAAFVADGSSIAVVETAAGRVTRTIVIGAPSAALALTAGDAPRLLVAAGSTVKRVDVAKTSAQSTDAGGAVTGIAAAGDLAFALLADGRKIVALNGPNGTVSGVWTLDAKPLAAAIDTRNHRLLVACDDRQLRVLDTDSGQVVTTFPIASGTTGVCFCPAVSTVFIAGAGTVDVLHQDDANHYSALKSISLPPGAHGPTIDPAGKLLTVVTDDGGKTTLCVFRRKE